MDLTTRGRRVASLARGPARILLLAGVVLAGSRAHAQTVTSFTANPLAVPPRGITQLSWTSTGATHCLLNWAAATASGTFGNGPANGGFTATMPDVAITFTLIPYAGAVAGTPKSVTVDVTVVTSITATPPTVTPGGSTVIAWTTTGATYCEIQYTSASGGGGAGNQPANGSRSYNPIETTTYKVTPYFGGVGGVGGVAGTPASVTVTVMEETLAVVTSITATPPTVSPGGATVIAWTTSGATSCTISYTSASGGGGQGPLPANGSLPYNPVETTTYTVTPYAGVTVGVPMSVTVTVTQAATPVMTSFTATPSTIVPGGSSVLSWTSTGAADVLLEPGIGPSPANGSVTVTPSATTTYKATAYTAMGVGSTPLTTTVTVGPASMKVPVVTNVRASQLPDGTGDVRIDYDLEVPAGATTAATSLLISPDGGQTFPIVPVAGALVGDAGAAIAAGARVIGWKASQTLPKVDAFYVAAVEARIDGTARAVSAPFRINLQNSKLPTAAFSFSPASPKAGESVTFKDESRLCPTSAACGASIAWDFGDDGTVDSRSATVAKTFAAGASVRVKLTATNSYGSDSTVRTVTVAPPAATPVVTRVRRTPAGVYLDSNAFDVELAADVTWNGAPGTVEFRLPGKPAVSKTGTATGASHKFRSPTDFKTGFTATEVTITAVNAAGARSAPFTESVWVFPWPSWLNGLGGVSVTQNGQGTTFSRTFQIPSSPLFGTITIPSAVPLLDGESGLTETYCRGTVSASTYGTASGYARCDTGFAVAGKEVDGNFTLDGTFSLGAPKGFKLDRLEITGSLSGTVKKEKKLGEVFPKLKKLEKKKIIGGPIKRLNETVTLSLEASPYLEANLLLVDRNGTVDWSGTLAAGLELKVMGRIKIIPGVQGRVWISGKGDVVLGFQAPVLRSYVLNAELGAALEINFFIYKDEFSAKVDVTCSGSATKAFGCKLDASTRPGEDLLAAGDTDGFRVIPRTYELFGPAVRVVDRPRLRTMAGTLTGTSGTSLVENVFAGAAPQLVPLGDGTSLLLFVEENLSLPRQQAPDVAWSILTNGSPSAPQKIAADTRLESEPVVARDAAGKVVAAWTRIKGSNAAAPVTDEDLAAFNKSREVVTSVYDVAARRWSEPVALTDDDAFDTGLVMGSDGQGRVVLSWLSIPDGSFESSADSPARVRSATWNGQSWSAVADAATGLVGARSLAGGFGNGKGALAVVRAVSDTSDSIDVVRFTAGTWSAPQGLPGAGQVNRSPAVAFDATGRLHVVWNRDGDLVHSIDLGSPAVVRQGSDSISLLGPVLAPTPDGGLVLVWTEAGKDRPAQLAGLVFDPKTGSWSRDLGLSADPGSMASAVALSVEPQGTVKISYLSTQAVSRDVTLEDGTVIAIPEEGRHDITVLEVPIVTDLAVTEGSAKTEPVRPAPGEAVVLTAEVRNSGSLPVATPVKVRVLVGANEATASTVGETVLQAPLPGGERRSVSVPYTFPASGGATFVVVDPENEVPEFTKANNRATVYTDNRPPVAVASADRTVGAVPLGVGFSASESADPDGDSLSYVWDFGDGSAPASGASVSHSFTRGGVRAVSLTVTDSRGASSTAVVTITAGESIPAIDTVSPASGPTAGGTTITISGSRFGAGARVLIGGAPARSVKVVDATTIVAETPSSEAAIVDVTVVSGDGAASTAPGVFQYVPGTATTEQLVPIVLDVDTGRDHFRSQATLTNRGTTPVTARLTYTPTFSDQKGGGSIDVTLGAGQQRVLDDVLGYLRAQGLPIPQASQAAPQGGTLALRFSGASSVDAVAMTTRTGAETAAPQPVGRAGLAYAGVPSSRGVTTEATLFGLRHDEKDRSNVAIANTTGDPLRVRVIAASGSGDGKKVVVRDALDLPPFGWAQLSSVLATAGITQGWVTVERTGTTGAFAVYGVVNDNGTGDGSYVLPTVRGVSGSSITVPALVETGAFESELVLANRGTRPALLTLRYLESLSPNEGAGGTASLTLQPGTQLIIPSAIDDLRKRGLAIGARDAAGYVGALRVTVSSAALEDVFAGARTASPSPAGGQFGLFTPGVYEGQEAGAAAYLYGLRADSINRSNVAVVHAGSEDSSPITLEMQAYDGDRQGAPAGSPWTATLVPGQWFQASNFLSISGVSNGWVKITRTVGASPWIAYGVVNDGGKPGERTGDGAFVPMVTDIPTNPPATVAARSGPPEPRSKVGAQTR